MKDLQSEEKNLKITAGFDRQPMELLQAGLMCSAEGVLLMIRLLSSGPAGVYVNDFRGKPRRRELQKSRRDVIRVLTRTSVQAGVSERRRRLMLCRWTFAEQVTLLISE